MMNMGIVAGLIKALAPGADPQVIEQAVTDWLDDHPEATTTVEDGSITEAKLAQDVLAELGEIEELKEAIENQEEEFLDAFSLTGTVTVAEFTKNKYIDVSGSTVDINDPKTSSAGYMYSVVPCHEGDHFIINGQAGGNPRLWTFIQGNGTVISRADNNSDVTNDVVTAPALSGYCIIQTKREGTNLKVTAKEAEHKYRDDCEPGSVSGTASNGINLATRNFERHRSQGLYKVIDNGVSVVIRFALGDISGIAKVQIIRYTPNFSDLKIIEETAFSSDGTIRLSPDDSYPYIKVLVYHSTNVYSFNGIDIYADGGIEKVYHPNIENANYASIPFNYVMYGRKMASGRLLLPPNYTMMGEKVPLVVYVHGSGGMAEWTSEMYTTSAREKCFRYLNNEGFAVFDCYPWAHDITLPNVGATYNPFQIPMNIRAFVEGAKYVCSRFNVDINNVALLCKSQGGNIGHWASVETEFPFRAVGLLAPTTDPVLQDTEEIFYSSNCRSILADLIDFEGTSGEKSAFVSSGSLDNADVQSFIAKNKGLLVALMPYARGLTNAGSVDDLCDGGFETITTTPQWMLDLGIPARQSGYDLIPKFAEHDDYVKNGQRPVRFWCAVDDAQTSTYGNYAIYRYLINGGSDAEFTFVPVGTGGHNSVDTSELAQRTSGTTSLGIAYTDVPVVYTQVAAFFHKYM